MPAKTRRKRRLGARGTATVEVKKKTQEIPEESQVEEVEEQREVEEVKEAEEVQEVQEVQQVQEEEEAEVVPVSKFMSKLLKHVYKLYFQELPG